MAFCEAVGVGNEPQRSDREITDTSVEPAVQFKVIIWGGAEKARIWGPRDLEMNPGTALTLSAALGRHVDLSGLFICLL